LAKSPQGTVGIDRQAEELVILNALRRILRMLRLSAVDVQAEVGVSAAQLHVLRHLSEDRDGASIGELAEQTLTDRSSVASVVDRLVASGLAERGISAEDRRRAEVWITRAGQKLISKAPQSPTAQLVSALDSLPDADLLALAKGLTTVVDAVGRDDAPEGSPAEDRGNGAAAARPTRK
jgi:DNA-binding MarR family transcriptional regulator